VGVPPAIEGWQRLRSAPPLSRPVFPHRITAEGKVIWCVELDDNLVIGLGMSDEDYGPKMAALSERQRAYIMAMLANPWGDPTKWAREAGYSDHLEAAKVRGHYLAKDPRISAAAREHAVRYLTEDGVRMACAVLVVELGNPDAKIRVQAANSILDRGGVTASHTLKVEHSHSAADMEKIALRLAGELGIEPMKLIGGNKVAKNITENIPAEAKMSCRWCNEACPPNRRDGFCSDICREHGSAAEPGDTAERKNQDKMDIDNDIAW
jgi:phage terminase small subunit